MQVSSNTRLLRVETLATDLAPSRSRGVHSNLDVLTASTGRRPSAPGPAAALPIENGTPTASTIIVPGTVPAAAAVRALAEELASMAGGDTAAARVAADALSTLADAYNERTAIALAPAIRHWTRVAEQLLGRAASPAASPLPAAPAPSSPVPASPAPAPAPTTSTSSPSPATSSNQPAPAAPRTPTYDDLPAHMKGGVSSGNGMPIILVNDPSEIELLPLWASMHPAASAFYRDLIAQGLAASRGQVMGLGGFEIHIKGKDDPVRTPVTSTTPATNDPAREKLREASVRLRGVDLTDINRDWTHQMIESGTATNPAFYALLETAAAGVRAAYREHFGREPTKDEMACWLPFSASMEGNQRQWAANAERLRQRESLDQVAALIAARPPSAPVATTPAAPATTPPAVTDAQIAQFVNANLQNPGAIASAMVQYGVSMGRLQAATGASWSDIEAYVASSNDDTLKRLLAQHKGAA